MHYDHLPIYKLALDLCVYVETIVKNFDKYFKYSTGSDLREYSKRILFGIHKANRSYEKSEWLEEIKQFLSVQVSFMGHIKHANSYYLQQKIGRLHETNPFNFDHD